MEVVKVTDGVLAAQTGGPDLAVAVAAGRRERRRVISVLLLQRGREVNKNSALRLSCFLLERLDSKCAPEEQYVQMNVLTWIFFFFPILSNITHVNFDRNSLTFVPRKSKTAIYITTNLF